MSATKDAPTFKIKTLTGAIKDNYYLHYIEYAADGVDGVLENLGTPTLWLHS